MEKRRVMMNQTSSILVIIADMFIVINFCLKEKNRKCIVHAIMIGAQRCERINL